MDYVLGVDYFPMDFSGEGDVTAAVTAVDVNLVGDRASTSGCEAADFAGFTAGNIALIQRGTCDFAVKADNAVAAGASGVIIFNQGNVVPGDDRLGLFGGTLGAPVRRSRSSARPSRSARSGRPPRASTCASTLETDDRAGDHRERARRHPDRANRPQVVIGGHLDSVAEGPGINDNGTGTAAILEIAIQMAKIDIEPGNRVRFAFWSGEEDGLHGSNYYVSQLTESEIKHRGEPQLRHGRFAQLGELRL